MKPCHVPPQHDLEVTKAVYIVGRDLKVSDKVMLAGFEAGWVESHMNNLPCGDLDSLGVFQQRPSQGWGTPGQIMHVPYAAEQFFTRAVRVEQQSPHLTAGQTAQRVQRSAFPRRYDQAETKARELLREARAAVGAPPRWASRVSVGVPSVVDHGSGMVVFGVDGSGGVVHRWQNVAGGAWSEWVSLGRPSGAAVGRPWALVGRYGKLVVFVRGGDGALWHTWQSEAGEWARDWASLGGRLASDPAVVLSPNGALSVFARDPDGRITHTWQRGPEHGHAWNDAWVDMEGAVQGRPTVVVGRDGGMVLFARGTDNVLHHRWQTGTGGPWSAWTPLHGRLTSDPAVVLSPNDALSVFARDPDGRVTHTWQRGPEHGHAWNDTWVDMEGAVQGRPTVLVGRDGGMVLFARGTDDALHHRWQTGTGGPWSAWTPLHGRLTSDPAVVLNPSGDLSVFGRAPDGHLTHTWQRGPEHGHAWNDTWADMGGELALDSDGSPRQLIE
ncbi:hypothetical protein SAMN05443665_103460 [Actinomadura meyerae]|uniref:PLL-like beta propeller domain-containing protein n=1 Tax=Actinomadura meyerae TaxID=240840 RepID=A0A239MZZ8_9ACTN|nr:hypothetical protein [Actinomadura meyerae]SNT48276.1 hypothetical protein SAMN05443665_103460 [Actinomadura meyerae]